jgi:hypothetical protein
MKTQIDDMDDMDDNKIQPLDSSWIDDFEKEDKLYKDFYLENLYYINLYFIYLDEYDRIHKTKKNKFFLNNNNYVSKEELFKIIMKNKEVNQYESSKEKYKLLFLFKYNFTMEPSNISHFLKNQIITDDFYLFPINSIEDIHFNKTIGMFQDLNSITIIYKKTSLNTSSSSEMNKNKTKKIRFKNLIKKTRRLYL